MSVIDLSRASSPAEPCSRRPLKRASLVVMLLVLVLAVAACGSDEPEVADGTTVSGVIVDVQGTLTEVERFDLVLEDGTRLALTPEAGALERSGFSPAHIREHSALVEPISVIYREVDGQNIVVEVGDAE